MHAQRPSFGTEAGARVETWTGAQFTARVADAMTIYVRAMRYADHTGVQRAVSARKHAGLDGFACRAAVDQDGRLVGFGYGYTTKAGQWWHDLVRKAMDRDAAAEWLSDAFELSELHVLPDHQGVGIGRRLLISLAAGIPHSAMLLSTPDNDTRAFRLYRGGRVHRHRAQLPVPRRCPAVRGAGVAAAVARWALT